MSPAAEHKMRVLAAMRAVPARTRSESRRRAPLFAGLAIGAMALVIYAVPPLLHATGGLTHAGARSADSGAVLMLGGVAIAMAATWVLLRRGQSMLGKPFLMGAVAAATPVLVGAWSVLCQTSGPQSFVLGWRCFVLTLLTAPWPFVAFVTMSRRLEPHWPGLAGAALGSTAGAWASVMVEMWCPIGEEGHVLRGHVLPFIVLTGLGALVGRRLFRA
jgi:hypothetical protein